MNKHYKRELSVVIPAYNEAGTIRELVKRLSTSLRDKEFTFEIIVVDDNSTDLTPYLINLLMSDYPLQYVKKIGKRGKAYSLVQGFANAKYENLAFIDADLQYSPEEIVGMALKLENADVVVANRKKYEDSFYRKILSRTFRYGFGKLLFGLDVDIQSGLKVFRKEVIQTVAFSPMSSWTFDLEFLHRANEAGYKILSHNISFLPRKKGNSHVSILGTALEIGAQTLKLRLKKVGPQHVIPQLSSSMKGAGVRFKKKNYVTHTTLNYKDSSINTFTFFQRGAIYAASFVILTGFLINFMLTLGVIIALMSFIYVTDTVFNLYIVLKSLHQPQELTVTDKLLKTLENKELPIYSILCPLYKESHIIPQFLNSISKLEWPKSRLDVMLLLEEDDKTSIEATKKMNLPAWVRVIVVPHSQPKTKPKACNYGLAFAKGEYLVVYDAEDMPDVMQLKKAYAIFQTVKSDVVCLQAKLNYYNPYQNLLTRFFTAEYSLWFDITLTGLQSIDTSIPLGGTSNHFRTIDLTRLQGWDPFNVTEDADLGMRLFKAGYKTAIIDSVTLEEANSKWGNWLRQRSRWIKGYMQTYLVHTRKSAKFAKEHGKHFPIFHLIIGGKIAFILINPFLWLATISYFTLYGLVGPAIESLYPSIVFYMAATSLVFGNFLFMYYYMIGAMKRNQYSLIKYTFLIPIYWIAISMAGFIALYQLFFKPHYWEKTVHGLHLVRRKKHNYDNFNIPKLILKPVKYAVSIIF